MFGLNIHPELQTTILSTATGIYAIIEAVKGFFTKDKEPTASK
jgi:hypothetical protein